MGQFEREVLGHQKDQREVLSATRQHGKGGNVMLKLWSSCVIVMAKGFEADEKCDANAFPTLF